MPHNVQQSCLPQKHARGTPHSRHTEQAHGVRAAHAYSCTARYTSGGRGAARGSGSGSSNCSGHSTRSANHEVDAGEEEDGFVAPPQRVRQPSAQQRRQVACAFKQVHLCGTGQRRRSEGGQQWYATLHSAWGALWIKVQLLHKWAAGRALQQSASSRSHGRAQPPAQLCCPRLPAALRGWPRRRSSPRPLHGPATLPATSSPYPCTASPPSLRPSSPGWQQSRCPHPSPA